MAFECGIFYLQIISSIIIILNISTHKRLLIWSWGQHVEKCIDIPDTHDLQSLTPRPFHPREEHHSFAISSNETKFCICCDRYFQRSRKTFLQKLLGIWTRLIRLNSSQRKKVASFERIGSPFFGEWQLR